MRALADSALDTMLVHQFTIAWAGEARCQPRRLGWWETDLIDPAGGGDFFARLMPRTHAWAALEAAREAARRTDAKARSRMANPDKVRSLFFLGFELDEQLADRLALLKRQGEAVAETLRLALPLGAEFSRDALTAALGRGGAEFTIVPGGRQLKGAAPKSPVELLARLGRALVPFAEAYPLPFYKLEG